MYFTDFFLIYVCNLYTQAAYLREILGRDMATLTRGQGSGVTFSTKERAKD